MFGTLGAALLERGLWSALMRATASWRDGMPAGAVWRSPPTLSRVHGRGETADGIVA